MYHCAFAGFFLPKLVCLMAQSVMVCFRRLLFAVEEALVKQDVVLSSQRTQVKASNWRMA
jgi:hypothetical protein